MAIPVADDEPTEAQPPFKDIGQETMIGVRLDPASCCRTPSRSVRLC